MREYGSVSSKVICSQEFLSLPSTAQVLYFHLSIRSEGSGKVNNPNAIIRQTASSECDLQLLIHKKYALQDSSRSLFIRRE